MSSYEIAQRLQAAEEVCREVMHSAASHWGPRSSGIGGIGIKEALRRWQETIPPVPLEPRCSVCGILRSEDIDGVLTDVTVITADGEEGFAHTTMLLCSDDLSEITEALIELGFKDHRHGGINYLEDPACPGYTDMKKCPTPSEYGEYVVPGPERTS